MNGSPSATVYEPTSESPQGPLTRAVFLLDAGPVRGPESRSGAIVRVMGRGFGPMAVSLFRAPQAVLRDPAVAVW